MNIVNLVIGNACSLLAMGTDTLSASRKKVKSMLWIQNISQALYCLGSLVLHGYSASVQNVVCILRNVSVIMGAKSKILQWFFVISGVVIGVYFNNLGFMGILPVIANLQYTLAILFLKNNERAVKYSFLLSAFLFSLFSLSIWNVVGIFTNLIVAGVTISYLVKTKPVKEK